MQSHHSTVDPGPRVISIIDEVIARAYKAVESDKPLDDGSTPFITAKRLIVAYALDEHDRLKGASKPKKKPGPPPL